jgi:methylenetetrahydrofolate reductase (NADH)
MQSSDDIGPAARLRSVLSGDRFAITAELECPRNASATNVRRQAQSLGPLVDAIDCSDNSAAIVRMSPVAAVAIARPHAKICVIQLTCRDRNRITLQSDLLGAAAFGAGGVVCIGGDPPTAGNHPQAKPVYDLTAAELIAMARGFNEGRFASGDPLDPTVDLVRGCVENPADGDLSVQRLAAKVEAGAEFVQTQIGFDLDSLRRWLELLQQSGLANRVKVLAGIAPIRRLAVARFLQTRVAGVTIPPQALSRLEQASDPEAEGVQIAAELLREARTVSGLSGVHLLTFGWAEGVRRVLEAEEAVSR